MSAPDNVEGMDADLQRMAGEVAAVDALAGGADQAGVMPGQQQDTTAQQVDEIKALLQLASGLFVPLFPKLAEVYTEQTCANLAGAIVPVMQKHGWNTGEILGKWAAELALLVVAAPVAIATYQVVVAQQEAAKAAAKEVGKRPIATAVPVPEQGAGEQLVAERG